MWIEAIIMPREEALPYPPSPPRDRRALHLAACRESLQFRDAVLSYLETNQLMGAVKWVSEPGSLPVVTLRCQERVLERLRKSPQFEAGLTLGLELKA